MRLHELNAVPNQVRDFAKSPDTQTDLDIHPSVNWGRQADSYAYSLGFSRIGSGHYSSVYVKDGYPYVLKIFSNGDTNYINWLKWCIGHRQNTYVPKTKGTVIRINKSLSAIRLELLTKNHKKLYMARILEKFFEDFDAPDTEEEYFDIALNKCYFQQNVIPEFSKDLIQVWEYLHSVDSAILDLHANNLMWRGEQPVIIDPVYTRGSGF